MDKSNQDKAILMAAFAKIDPIALAIAVGCIWGLMLFLATGLLLTQGTSEGQQVGPHLTLLGIYLPGYNVSWFGALLGAFYFGIIGSIGGFVIAVIWNLTHYIYIVLTVARAVWWKMMAD